MQLKTNEVNEQTLRDGSRLEGSVLSGMFQMYSHAEEKVNCHIEGEVDTVKIKQEDRFSALNRRDCMIFRAGQCLGKEDLLLMNLNRKRKFTAQALSRCRFLFLHHDHYMQYLGSQSVS